MSCRAVFFDLDGTLLDTLKDIADCCNHVLLSLGMPPHSMEEYKYFVGEGRDVLVQRMLPASRRDLKTVEQAIAAVDEEYLRHWADTTAPYPGILELLRSLTGQGIVLAVISNKADEFTRQAVAQMLSEFHFAAVCGARPNFPKKPDPSVALKMAISLGIAPRDVVFLGDTDIDMKTARAAGMRPIGALWGFRDAAELLAGGAEALLRTPADLLELL